jgi:hypothetical protein
LFGAQQSQAEQEVSSTNESRDLLPQVWWTDGGHPEVHRCGHPTFFSTAGHCCRMKRLSPARILRAFRRARSPASGRRANLLLPLPRRCLRDTLSRQSAPAVLCRTVSATPHTAVSPHSISIGPASSAATTGGFLLTALSNARRAPCLP